MPILNINVKRFSDSAHLPKYTTRGSATADLVAVKLLKNGIFHMWYDCEIAVAIPAGHAGLLFPMNNIHEMDLSMPEGVVIVNSDYRGTIQIRFTRTLKGLFTRKKYKVGERIARLMIVKLPRTSFIDSASLAANEQETRVRETRIRK